MGSQLSGAQIFELEADRKQFEDWRENVGDADFVAHSKYAALVAMDEELTEKQRMYFDMYYLHGLTIVQIAQQQGVNKSTVSRSLIRAKRKLQKVLRYSAPHLLNTPCTLKNRRIPNGY